MGSILKSKSSEPSFHLAIFQIRISKSFHKIPPLKVYDIKNRHMFLNAWVSYRQRIHRGLKIARKLEPGGEAVLWSAFTRGVSGSHVPGGSGNNFPSLTGTFFVLALKVPYPWKTLDVVRYWTVGHLTWILVLRN